MSSRKPLSPAEKAARLKSMQQRSVDNVAAEIRRIIDVPLAAPLDEELIDAVSAYYVKPEEYAKGFRLLPRQAEGLAAYNEYGGVFGPIPVGDGKTLTSLLIADDCYREILQRMHKTKDTSLVPRALLIIPSQVLAQLRDRDVAFARKYTRFSCPVFFVGGVSKSRRLNIAKSQRRGLYITTYSLLSAEGADELLEGIDASCVVCDEAHNVAVTRQSARAKRFKRFIDARQPQVVALSGTLTKKSPMEYHYLAMRALGANNFLPNAVTLAEAWSMIIDSTASSMSEFGSKGVPQAGPILPLIDWARANFPDEEGLTRDLLGFRKAFSLRLRSTPGVVCGGTDSLGVSLSIENRPVPRADQLKAPGWERLKELVADVVDNWQTPNGDEIDHAMHVWKWRYELEGAGFYNELYWPEAAVLAKRSKVSIADAENILEKSKKYHRLQQEYHKELRAWIKDHSRPGLDTPRQIGLSMHNHGDEQVGHMLFATWKQMKDADFEGRIDRDSRAIRVCDFKIRHCVEDVKRFVKKNPGEGLLIWYYHQEAGSWLHESLRAAGIESVHCPAGEQYNKLIVSDAVKDKVVVASITAHGTGKNLQCFGTQYFFQWARDAAVAEQAIGRSHRTGQDRDEVLIITCNSVEFDRVTFSATLNDAAYVSQSLGTRQKLMYANYNPLPEQVPFAVMHEWGLQPKKLSEEARSILGAVTAAGKSV
jgi:hypothetical protein